MKHTVPLLTAQDVKAFNARFKPPKLSAAEKKRRDQLAEEQLKQSLEAEAKELQRLLDQTLSVSEFVGLLNKLPPETKILINDDGNDLALGVNCIKPAVGHIVLHGIW